LHDLRLTEAEDRVFDLTPCTKESLAFVAPKGARCVVTWRPANSCGVRTKVLAVRDPSGGRALAPQACLQGAPEPKIDSGRGNESMLDFIAPKSGRYHVVFTAEEGTEGKTTAHVAVRQPECRGLDVIYDGCGCAPSKTASLPRPASSVASR
jgi:hypothetical protein